MTQNYLHQSNTQTQDPLPPSDRTIDPVSSSTSPLLSSALTSLLVSVCTQTDWEYGECWIPNTNHNLLEVSSIRYVNTKLDIYQTLSWMQFQMCSQAFVLEPGEGLPGRVWQSQKPEWIDDVSDQSETYFLRNQIAKALSVKAGFGIPIAIDSYVVAVIVFFMSTTRSHDRQQIELIRSAIANFKQNLIKELFRL
ncbi:MAG: GAF domain-containing protein [Hydrococcus sp. Prado102]|jgi:hypothetical protein|nr:GAF domain-containing protein [Hydrococcus sp. Prado102]